MLRMLMVGNLSISLSVKKICTTTAQRCWLHYQSTAQSLTTHQTHFASCYDNALQVCHAQLTSRVLRHVTRGWGWGDAGTCHQLVYRRRRSSYVGSRRTQKSIIISMNSNDKAGMSRRSQPETRHLKLFVRCRTAVSQQTANVCVGYRKFDLEG